MVRGRLQFSLPREFFCVSVADDSLRTLSILHSDMLVCTKKPFYEDNDLIFCRTTGTQSDPLQVHVPADAYYYVGHYRQISELVTVVLPSGAVLAGDVLILATVAHVLRFFE